MTEEQPRRRAADDVADDMRRRLEELGEHVHDAERQAHSIPPNPLSRIAGDPEAIPEGPRSGGGTLGGSRRHDEAAEEDEGAAG